MKLDWKHVVCYCVTMICLTIFLLPLTYTETLAIKVVANHEMDNLRNSIRFSSIESTQMTVLTELNIYKKIKRFNKKFVYGIGGK